MKMKWIVFFWWLAFAISVNAQVITPNLPSVDQAPRPVDRQLSVPEPFETHGVPSFKLPDIVDKGPESLLSTGLQVYVKRYHFTGNSVFSDDDLREISSSYSDRVVNSQELEQLRRLLTLHYVDNGYINSGVLIPDQKVVDGIVNFQIIEGVLGAIEVIGNTRLKEAYLQSRLLISDSSILNLNMLQDQLKLLQKDPLIKKLHANLVPGARRGEALLGLQVEEEKPYSLHLKLNNHRPPSVGGEVLELELQHLNLTGMGNAVYARAEKADGLEDIYVSYTHPVGKPGSNIGLHYEKTDSIIVEDPFSLVDIENESETIGINYRHKIRRTIDEQLTLGVGFERRKSSTFLLGLPFSFSPGVENGESKVSVMRLSLDWLKESPEQVIAARSLLSIGLDKFDATSNSEVSSQFVSWLGQLQIAKRLYASGMQVIGRLSIQAANDALLPMEKFSIGGNLTVRGYRENQLVRDNGIVSSVELRFPVFRQTFSNNSLQLAPFIDSGYAWNKRSGQGKGKTLSSFGLGVLWSPENNFYAKVYAAKALEDVTTGSDEHDIQDSGVHFQMGYQIF